MSVVEAVVFEALFADARCPERATEESAGYDVHVHLAGRTVRVAFDGTVFEQQCSVGPAAHLDLAAGHRATVPLGFRARLPAGHEAQVRLRSSVAFRKGLVMPNAPGTIDADYPDEWMVMLKNDTARAVRIEHGERIAQVVIARYVVLPWEPGAVGVSTSRTGGVGSTG